MDKGFRTAQIFQEGVPLIPTEFHPNVANGRPADHFPRQNSTRHDVITSCPVSRCFLKKM